MTDMTPATTEPVVIVRPEIESMTDRELAEETVRTMREVADAVAAFENLPMVKALAEGKNPLMAMMGR